MSQQIKRHLISAGVTFIAGFLLAAGPLVGQLTAENLTTAAIFGIISVAARAGVKLVYEAVLSWLLSRKATAVDS